MKVAITGTDKSRLPEVQALLADHGFDVVEVNECDLLIVLPGGLDSDHAAALLRGVPSIEVHP